MNILMNNLLYFFTDLCIAFFVNNVQFLVKNKNNLMILNIIIFYDLILAFIICYSDYIGLSLILIQILNLYHLLEKYKNTLIKHTIQNVTLWIYL